MAWLEGYKLFIIIVVEVMVYLFISKAREKATEMKCPKCQGLLVYRAGLQIIKFGVCPHCEYQIINDNKLLCANSRE